MGLPTWTKVLSPAAYFLDIPGEGLLWERGGDFKIEHAGYAAAAVATAWFTAWALKATGEALGPLLAEDLYGELTNTEAVL